MNIMNILERYFDSVIFDMDGLILDNGHWYQSAYQNAAQKMGYGLKDELYEQLLGLPHIVCDKILKETFGKEFSIKTFNELMEEEYQATIEKDGIKFRDGFEALFSYLKRQGIPIGLATNSTLSHVKNNLRQTSYLESFDVICTADDIQRGKPDPEIYILATHRMNCQTKNTIVFEDSNKGMKAAIAAGCMGIMIPNQALPEAEVKDNAFLVMNSLNDIIPLIH